MQCPAAAELYGGERGRGIPLGPPIVFVAGGVQANSMTIPQGEAMMGALGPPLPSLSLSATAHDDGVCAQRPAPRTGVFLVPRRLRVSIRAHDSGFLVLNTNCNGSAEIRGTTRSAARVLREVRGEFVGEEEGAAGDVGPTSSEPTEDVREGV
jgi:hypothetical protein